MKSKILAILAGVAAITAVSVSPASATDRYSNYWQVRNRYDRDRYDHERHRHWEHQRHWAKEHRYRDWNRNGPRYYANAGYGSRYNYNHRPNHYWNNYYRPAPYPRHGCR